MARQAKKHMELPANLPPSESALLERVHRWHWNSEIFIQEAILDPRGLVNGERLRLSTQQIEACKELNNLVRAKTKLAKGDVLTDEERVYVNKLGISIMSGKGTGKDAWTSWVIIWFQTFFDDALCPCTAPTDHQLKDVLWAEISRWLRTSLVKDLVIWQATKIFNIKGQGRNWFAIPRTANLKSSAEEQALTLQGFHSPNMMLVVDEASGVPDPVFEAFDSTMTAPNNFALLIFNPNRSTGYALKTHIKNRQDWICLHWNAEDSELVTRESIAKKKEMYGEDSNYYRVNVLGLPPTADSDSLIPWDWIMDARARDIEPDESDYLIKACDFGAGGDKSIILTRQGGRIMSIRENSTKDSNELVDWVVADFVRDEADMLLGDNIGIGWAVMGQLKSRLSGSKVRCVDSRNRASRPERFSNKRAEMYWNLRTDFENKDISLKDLTEYQYDRIMGQLNATKYSDDGRTISIINKRKIKDVTGESPDDTDALAISSALGRQSMRKPKRDPYEAGWRGSQSRTQTQRKQSWMAV